MFQITIGSRVRKSPFFRSTVDAGVTAFTVYNHMYMPTSFGDHDAEYERLTTGVALWDVAAERQVEISGPDAAELTQRLSARNLKGMAVGRARYAPMCDHLGLLINDPVILRVAEDTFWISIADSDILLWAKAIAGERDADVTICEPDVSPLAIQGPKAINLARDLFGAELVDGLGFFHHAPLEIEGVPLVICRSGWSKQGGYELFLTDSTKGNELWDLVMAAGEQYGIGPGTPNHRERIESGLLSYASDNDIDTDPYEAMLGQYVSIDAEHGFIGKKALAERLADEPKRRTIVNVELIGDVPACESPWPATLDGQPAGQIRNSTWSPRLKKFIGIGFVPARLAVAGSVLEVDADGVAITATITREPFGTVRTH